MNKIINWTFGSIFRTIGRVIGYFIISCIIGLILSSNDFKITDLLGIEKVSASTITYSYDWYKDQSLTQMLPSQNDLGRYINTSDCNNNSCNFWAKQNLTWSKDTYKYIYLNVAIQNLNANEYSNTSSSYTLYNDASMYIWVRPIYQDDTTGICELLTQYNDYKGKLTYRCTVSTTATKLKRVNIVYNNTKIQENTNILQVFSNIGIERAVGYDLNDDKSLNNSIENQTQQQHQDAQNTQDAINNTKDAINDTKDALLDDEVSDDEISSSLEFDNITDNSLGPFATFLTLPLTWVQNILASNQVCNEIDLPLPFLDVDMTLPCMNSFWNSLGVLGTLIQAVWLAVVGVRIFNGLFLLTVDTISSKDNDDELMKIKSWEL